jgi:hypothetical protein
MIGTIFFLVGFFLYWAVVLVGAATAHRAENRMWKSYDKKKKELS